MGANHVGMLRALVVSAALLVGVIHCAVDPQETTLPDRLVFDYNCTAHGQKDFDRKELPPSYHELQKFTIRDCKTVDFGTEETPELLQWQDIQFQRINSLKLRLTQLPNSIESIQIDNVRLNHMSITQFHLGSTLRINSLEIKNSVVDSTSMGAFLNPTFTNITFHNVTFHKIISNDLAFKFSEDSHLKITSSIFHNEMPSETIKSNATHIHIEDTTFASKLKRNAVKFMAGKIITIKNVTFTDLDENSVELSASSVELLSNTFKKSLNSSINMLNYTSLIIANNTFWQNAVNPIYWKLTQQEMLPEFDGNNFQCDTSASSNATKWIVDSIEEFELQNRTFCDVMAANNHQNCECQTTKFLSERCMLTNGKDKCDDPGNGSSKKMSTLIYVVGLVIFDLFH